MKCNSCFSPVKEEQERAYCGVCKKVLHKECSVNEEGKTYCDRCYSDKDTVTEKIDVPDILRRSYIQTYKDCPYKFYNQVIKGIEGEMPIHAQVGIDLHDLFEQVSKKEIENSRELIDLYKPIFDGYTDEMFEGALHLYRDMTVSELKNKLWLQSVECAHQIFPIIRRLPDTPFALEEKLLLDVGEDMPKVSITMDRLDLIDGEIEITDWKTGAVMVGQKLSSDIQVPLYIKTVQEHYGIPVRKFTLQYVSEGKNRVFTRTTGDNYECVVGKRKYIVNTTDVVREVQHVFSQIINGNFNIPTDSRKMYFTCKTCHLKKMGVCQGADIQSWRNVN